MATYTSNYGWTKPSGSDNVDISVLNNNLDDQDRTIHDAFLNMAPPFLESSTYAVDDIVLYGRGLYKCHTAVVTPGSWTGSTNWQVYKLSEGGSGGSGGGGGVYYLENGKVAQASPAEYITTPLDVPMVPGRYLVRLRDNGSELEQYIIWSGTETFNFDGKELTITANTAGLSYYGGAYRDIYCDIISTGQGDYADLINKPSINDVELSGNKTASELGLQDELTFDNVPTANSNNPVKSGGVYASDEAIRQWTTAEAKSVSGNPIVITDGSARNAEALSVELEPIQDLHGYDKPWAGGAGKNKLPMVLADIKSANTGGTWSGNAYTLNGVTFTVLTDDGDNVTGVKVTGTASATTTLILLFTGINATQYTLTGCPSSGSTGTYFLDTFGTGISRAVDTGSGVPFTANGTEQYVRIGIMSGYTIPTVGLTFYPMIRLSTVSDATFEPYSNECPIEGYTECVVDRDSRNLYAGGNQSFTGIKEVNVSLKAGTYTISATTTTTATNRPTIVFFNGTTDIGRVYLPTGTRTSATITLPQDVTSVKFQAGETLATASSKDATFTDVQIEYGDTATAYVPYSHAQATITFGQTVYGGSVDFKIGKVTVTHVVKDLGTLDYTAQTNISSFYTQLSDTVTGVTGVTMDGICSQYKAVPTRGSVSEMMGQGDNIFAMQNGSKLLFIKDTSKADLTAEQFKTAMDGVHLCYELATPIELTLTPAELKLLKGYNYITTNGTTIALDYLPDSLLAEAENYVDAKIPPAPSSDGTYVLTCTVTDGTPAYSWENAT